MSGLELAAGVVLANELMEAKYHVREDFGRILKVVRTAIPFLYDLYRGKVSYWYHFERSVYKYPNRRAVVFPRPKANPPPLLTDENGTPIYDNQFELESFTYKEFYDMVLRLSHILKYEYGVTADQTIGLNCMNKPLFLLVWFALWNIGALPSFLNFNTKDQPLVHCLKIAHVSQVFTDPDCDGPIRDTEPQIKEQLPNVKLHYFDEPALLKRLSAKTTPKYRAPDNTRRPNDTDSSPAILIYTSGTTGFPKSAIMSWRKAYMAAMLFAYMVKIKKDSTVLTAMPLYHSTAAMLGVCPMLTAGGCIAISQKFSSSTFWTQAKLSGSTHVQYVGEVCRYLLNSKPHPDQINHNVRIAYGNGLRPDIWTNFKKRFGIQGIGEFYASTESPIATTNLQYGEYGVGACRSYGSLINLILSSQQAIAKMNPDDDNEIWRDPSTGFGVRADANEPGELLMRILNPKDPLKTFQGYYGNKEATSSKIMRDVFKKGDAWFRSGDLLKLDKDGLLYFVDRLGDTFRWKSENVSATEVENELIGSGVLKQTVVVGVRVPKHEGRAGYAVVVPEDEYMDSSKHPEMLQKLCAHSLRTLPKYAIPQFVKINSEIKASHNYKVPKNQFKNQKLPKGEDGTETIYWLNNGKYDVLTENDWDSIQGGKTKL